MTKLEMQSRIDKLNKRRTHYLHNQSILKGEEQHRVRRIANTHKLEGVLNRKIGSFALSAKGAECESLGHQQRKIAAKLELWDLSYPSEILPGQEYRFPDRLRETVRLCSLPFTLPPLASIDLL